MYSLRCKIVCTLVLALAVFGALATLATFFTTRAELSELLDTQLQRTALAISEQDTHALDQIALLGNTNRHALLVQIYEATDNRAYISGAIQPLPIAKTEGLIDVKDADGALWREFVVIRGTRTIQVAQPFSFRDQFAWRSALQITRPLFVLLLVLALVIWFISAYFLAPLNRIAKAVSQRKPDAMDPLPTVGLAPEIKSLIEAINALLKRLRESLAVQQRFASDAAHELRTPLTAIRLQAQLLARARTKAEQEKQAQRLTGGVQRATRLVEQLLTLTRLDPEATQKPFERVDLSALAASVASDLAVVCKDKHLALSVQSDSASIDGMPEALRLLMTNLVENAIRFTPEGGHILLEVRKTASEVSLSVSDDGPGIAPEERHRVFERFYRGLGTRVCGTGLGLAIVYRIVQLHAGSIHVEDGLSRAGGFGARFLVRFPLAEKALLQI